MSKGRFGGFRKGRKRLFDNWSIMRSEAVDVPATIQNLDYTKAKGIWNLKSTIQFPKVQSGGGGGGTFPWGSEASNLGTPTATYAQNDTFSSPSGTSDITIAVDFDSGISTSDYGNIIDFGGSARGFTVNLDDSTQEICFNTNDITSTASDFSSYYSQQGTLYIAIDVSSGVYLYWWDGTSMNFIGQSLATISDFAGSDQGSIGSASTSEYTTLSTRNNNAFTGTISEARLWNGTYFDFSTV